MTSFPLHAPVSAVRSLTIGLGSMLASRAARIVAFVLSSRAICNARACAYLFPTRGAAAWIDLQCTRNTRVRVYTWCTEIWIEGWVEWVIAAPLSELERKIVDEVDVAVARRRTSQAVSIRSG